MTEPSSLPGPPRPGPRPGPRAADPAAASGADGHDLADLSELVPDAETLNQLSVREHVAVYEDLQRALAERLDDAGR